MKNIKLLSMVCILFVTTVIFAQNEESDDYDIEKLTGEFQGYNEKENTYHFVVSFEEEGNETLENIKFIIKNEKIASKYNLKLEALIGQSFTINYTVEVKSDKLEDGTEDFFEIYTIRNLNLIE